MNMLQVNSIMSRIISTLFISTFESFFDPSLTILAFMGGAIRFTICRIHFKCYDKNKISK